MICICLQCYFTKCRGFDFAHDSCLHPLLNSVGLIVLLCVFGTPTVNIAYDPLPGPLVALVIIEVALCNSMLPVDFQLFSSRALLVDAAITLPFS